MDDLTAEFLEETIDSLEELDNDLVTLEQDPGNTQIIGNIFRVMHTIKGTCGFLGFSRLEKVAHSGENIMDKIRDGVIEARPDVVSLVLEAIDRIKEIIEGISQTEAEPEGDDSALTDKLNAFAEGGGVAATPTAEADVAAPAEAAEPPAEAPEATPPQAPAADANKTPDLDYEIDFEPTKADYAAGDEEKQEATPAEGPKTPDLDYEIGFEPVKADYAGNDGADEPGEAAAPAAPVAKKEELPEETKAMALEEGLKAAQDAGKKKSTAGQSIRVSLDVLENLMQEVSELVLTRNQLLQMMRTHGDSEFAGPLQRLNHITTSLQEGVMKSRMQPVGNAWAKFPRLIRDLAKDLNKKIELKMIGAETELDRQLLDAIKDPLTHMVRNSADHGLETPEERKKAGKPETGTVTLNAYHEGGHIIILIQDNGRGLNVDKIREKAIANGLTTADKAAGMNDKQIYQFIFKPGFSTAEKVTSVSGRGVGMDVVVTNIESIGGTVELDSAPGKGSTFMIKIPLTLAIMSVLIVECKEELFAIPQIRVAEIVRAKKTGETKGGEKGLDYVIETINGAPVLRLRGRLLPLISLSTVLELDNRPLKANNVVDMPAAEPEEKEEDAPAPAKEEKKEVAAAKAPSSGSKDTGNVVSFSSSPAKRIPREKKSGEPTIFVVVCEVGAASFGLMVDKVFHTEEIVVKPVAPVLSGIEVYSGCTILGDGNVIMILDPNGIIKSYGPIAVQEEKDGQEGESIASEQQMVSFLVFKAWSRSPKVVPLELVARLEEIDMSKVEWSGEHRVVQYRGNLMRLITMDPATPFPEEGIQEVIVFADGDKIMGVVVEEILDITEERMKIKSAVGKDGLLGSIVLNDVATDLIDVSYFFERAYGSWFEVKDLSEESLKEGPKHILLVDDSPFFRKFMKPVLVVAGYHVSTAENALDAIAMFEEGFTCDLVLSDIDMPEMNGIEFVKRCKADARFASMPFVALTAHTKGDVVEKNAELGFSGYVAKDNRDMLIDVIKTVLNPGSTKGGTATARG